MEALRKRRASTEVQELMNAVKNDYDFFARVESSFSQSAPPSRRQRSLSDNVMVQYAVVRPKPRYNQGLNLCTSPNEKYSDKHICLNDLSPELLHIPLQDQRRMLSRGKSREQTVSRDEHEQSGESFVHSRDQNEQSREQSHGKSREQKISRGEHERSRELLKYSRDQSREQEDMFHKTTPDFWAGYAEGKLLAGKHHKNPFTSRTRITSQPNLKHNEPWPEMTNPIEEYICLSSQPIILRDADDMVARRQRIPSHKAKRLPPVIEEQLPEDAPPLLIRVDTNTARRVAEDEPRSYGKRTHSRSTEINFGGLPMSETPVYETPEKIRRISIEREQDTMESPLNLGRKSSLAQKLSESESSEDELVIVESLPLSCRHNQSPANQSAQESHVNSPLTNEKPEESKKIERMSPDEESPPSLSPSGELWPDYVITRVGSLLWLDKDIVYPITLDEMRRRIKAPENFSFQMLIAYVRHSRAKGRQFLDYWKCQPSGKTSRPNVLSKLCEADATELVKGIQKVNEEYFPHESLARNSAVSIFQENGNRLTEKEDDGKKEQDLFVEKKVNAIEKSRSLFKLLQKTLNSTQNDERFNTFNVASHNAGVANIKNSLDFLDGIFERIQNHVQGKNSLAALTA